MIVQEKDFQNILKTIGYVVCLNSKLFDPSVDCMVRLVSVSFSNTPYTPTLKVTVQFERCFRLMEHISVIS